MKKRPTGRQNNRAESLPLLDFFVKTQRHNPTGGLDPKTKISLLICHHDPMMNIQQKTSSVKSGLMYGDQPLQNNHRPAAKACSATKAKLYYIIFQFIPDTTALLRDNKPVSPTTMDIE
jgi:hypothetical protein